MFFISLSLWLSLSPLFLSLF
ncbi:hypothetical protein Godav_006275 [Gossypium davidsonii]|uniref:Uncharacterized protein n=1 Tax=Gossypium davidsonii TaxID=34287 RepID=A0A7J8S4R5_GOSDV|nr:hypothetical protein [Gossypium davidsonii]